MKSLYCLLRTGGTTGDRPSVLRSEADTARRQAVSMHEGVVVVSAIRLAKTLWQSCQGQPDGGTKWYKTLLNHDDGD